MKTSSDIILYLKNSAPSSFMDRGLISYYVQTLGINGNIEFSDDASSRRITVRDFVSFLVGMEMVIGRYYKIIDKDGVCVFGVYDGLSEDSFFPSFSYVIRGEADVDTGGHSQFSPLSDFSEPSVNDLEYINRSLMACFMMYEEDNGVSKCIPNDQLARLSLYWFYNKVTGVNILGIYNGECNGNLEVRAYVDSEGKAHFENVFYELDPIGNYVALPASKRDYEDFNKILLGYGKEWSGKTKRVRPAQDLYRARKVGKDGRVVGGKYYYITSVLKVNVKMDTGCPTDNYRFYGGNYFITEEEANEALGEIIHAFMKIQASKTLYKSLELPGNVSVELNKDSKGSISKRKRGFQKK